MRELADMRDAEALLPLAEHALAWHFAKPTAQELLAVIFARIGQQLPPQLAQDAFS